MNVTEFRVEMLRHDDTNDTLAKALNVTSVTISNKINGNTDWTRPELSALRKRYSMSNDRFMEIFFDEKVS